jgi:protein-S-isoprenylcysteine O-methyltransferase Ste14
VDQKLVSPVLMWAIIISGIVDVLYFIPSANIYSPGILHRVAFSVALIYWIALFAFSLYYNREAAKSAMNISGLVTAGPYSIVRHPIYSSDIILAWGIVIGFPKLNLLAAAIWTTVIMMRWAFLEESALTDRFGDGYMKYKQTTPMLIPKYSKIFPSWRAKSTA